MSELKNIISENIKSAMKAKEKEKLNALRYIKKLLIDNETSKKPIEEQDIIIGHYKKLNDSISMYPEASDQQVAIKTELEYIKEYMPKEMDESEVTKHIKDIIQSGANNFGLIMKELSPKIKGRFDGKKATELVKKELN
jgi:uncharacterized protein YqeY